MIPLSNSYCITDQEPTTDSGFSLMSVIDEEDPLFINDVVFPEYADQFSVYDISYYYGQEKSYHEKIILPGQTLTIKGKIKNKKTTATKIGEEFYTQRDGQARYVKLSGWYTIEPGKTIEVSWDVPSEWTAYPPESDPVYPSNWISDEGGLTTEHQDYFGNNIKESVLVDKDNFIKGKIDDTGDIDCIKFNVEKDGYYEVSQLNGVQLTGQLYAENLIDTDDPLNGFEQKISSITPNENLLWGGYLIGGNTYAMKLVPKTVGATGDYTCAISVDTDGDGLPDVWERTGDIDGDGTIDIEGADPDKTDVFVEINWMTGFKPEQESLDIVAESFTNSGAGYKNNGINLHNVWGKEYPHIEVIEFTEDEEGNVNLDTVLEPYITHPIRLHAYHCALFGDRYCLSSDETSDTKSSGYASFDDLQVLFIARGCRYPDGEILDTEETAGTYMHELGHNFNLDHGGQDSVNYKPNYISVMNYPFQFDGLAGTGQYDYAHYLLPDLNENALIESAGIDPLCVTEGTGIGTAVCGQRDDIAISGRSYDFNNNGTFDEVPVSYDINEDGKLTVLKSFTDWDALVLKCGKIGSRINSNPTGFALMSVESHRTPIELPYSKYEPYGQSSNN